MPPDDTDKGVFSCLSFLSSFLSKVPKTDIPAPPAADLNQVCLVIKMLKSQGWLKTKQDISTYKDSTLTPLII